MVDPNPTDIVYDPACGTCDFLVAVGESLRAGQGRAGDV